MTKVLKIRKERFWKMKNWKKNLMGILSVILFCFCVIGSGTTASAAEQTIVPTYIGSNENTNNANTYNYQINGNSGILSVPVQVSRAGAVKLEVTTKTSAETMCMVLSESAQSIDSSAWLSVSYALSNQTITLDAYAKGACTWYLYVFSDKANSDKEVAVTVKAYQREVSAGGTLSKGKWVSGYAIDTKPVYYKIKVTSSGCLKLETSLTDNSENESGITLLNSKKKAISSSGKSESKVTYYGVKKGTYYLKLENAGDYKIRYTFEQIGTKNNTKKSKAINLKRGKTDKGLFILGDKKNERWYKINLNKKQTVKLNISVKGNEYYTDFTVYQLNGKKTKIVKSDDLKNGKNTAKVKLKKGTYYIVIDSEGTGSYSIQWK